MHDTFIKSLHHKSMLIFWWHIQVTSQLHLPKLQWNKRIHEQKSNLLNISRWMEKWNCMTLGAVRCGQYLLWSVAMMQKWQQSNNNNNKFNLKERRPARVISLNYKTKGTLQESFPLTTKPKVHSNLLGLGMLHALCGLEIFQARQWRGYERNKKGGQHNTGQHNTKTTDLWQTRCSSGASCCVGWCRWNSRCGRRCWTGRRRRHTSEPVTPTAPRPAPSCVAPSCCLDLQWRSLTLAVTRQVSKLFGVLHPINHYGYIRANNQAWKWDNNNKKNQNQHTRELLSSQNT